MENIGRYKIIKRLGGGGFGEVYLAHDDRLHRDVAIKVFKPKDENLAAIVTANIYANKIEKEANKIQKSAA